MRGLLYFASVVVAALSPSQAAEGAIGLKCSQWLDPRTYLHYDARTKQITDGRPPKARPVSEDVKVATVSGHHSLDYLATAIGRTA
jgi:hypothetical protein